VREESRPALEKVAQNGAHPDASTRTLPGDIAVKCPNCRELLVGKDWRKNQRVCQRCGYHFRLSSAQRIDLLLDSDSFEEFAGDLRSADPLHFVSRSVTYPEYLRSYRERSGVNEAVMVGRGRIEGMPLIVAVMDSNFIGGSMGSVVGERVAVAVERAAEERIPLVIVAASGGARMQEGMLALMQMAKTSAALSRLAAAGVPYISLLTDPSTGGVVASFALLGDVILAEPGALVGFAGPRVIEQFMHARLPKDTATAEFALAHGMLDGIVHRRDLRATLSRLLRLFGAVGSSASASAGGDRR
jgi:acetyl-CoA carboxylase carboxyl transferase subunit beta